MNRPPAWALILAAAQLVQVAAYHATQPSSCHCDQPYIGSIPPEAAPQPNPLPEILATPDLLSAQTALAPGGLKRVSASSGVSYESLGYVASSQPVTIDN
jgi:hypothetical protein